MSKKPLPFSIATIASGAFQCARTSDGRFHVYKEGAASSLIVGADFSLVNDSIRSVLDSLVVDQVMIRNAEVLNLASGKQWAGYFEVIPLEPMRLEAMAHIDCRGYKIWGYGGVIFVSPDLKNEIESAGIKDVSFHEGFSRLAGST